MYIRLKEKVEEHLHQQSENNGYFGVFAFNTFIETIFFRYNDLLVCVE